MHVNLGKTEAMQLLDGKGECLQRLIPVVFVEIRLGLTQSNVCSVKSGLLIVVAQMFHMESVLLLCVMSLFVDLVFN